VSHGDVVDGALERERENPISSKSSRFRSFPFVSISLPPRYHLVTTSLLSSLPSRYHLVTISLPPRYYPRYHLVTTSLPSRFHLVATGHILYYMLPLHSVHLISKGRSLHSQRGLQASAKGLGSRSLPTSGLVQGFRFVRCLAGLRVGSRG